MAVWERRLPWNWRRGLDCSCENTWRAGPVATPDWETWRASRLVRCIGWRPRTVGRSLKELRFVCVLLIAAFPIFSLTCCLIGCLQRNHSINSKPEDMPRYPGYCKDVNENCAMWEAMGECESNAEFMVSTSVFYFFLMLFDFCLDFFNEKAQKIRR